MSAMQDMPDKRGRGRQRGYLGWRVRYWAWCHGILDALRLPPPTVKTAAMLNAAIAEGRAPGRFLRSTKRGRPRKSHTMEHANV